MIVALIGYCASMVCLFLLCRTVGEQKKFPVAIAVHNWAAPIVSLAFLPLLALTFFLGGDGSEGSGNVVLDMISVLWIGVLVLAGLRLLRLSLDLTMSKAAVFFVITAAVSLVTTQGLESLLGLANPT
jgi:formate-dependent nitrite reductase membrane component NrfD